MVGIPGEIYFIRETDYHTGELTPFTKIGIVRDHRERTSEQRLTEHQTGNPRPLVLYRVVHSPMVEWIETQLHHRNSAHRVEGEWFNFDENQLSAAILMATDLAAQAKEALEMLNAAELLGRQFSDGTTIQPKDETRRTFMTYWLNKSVSLRVEKFQSKLKSALAVAHSLGEAGSVLGAVREHEGSWSFDQKLFRARYPEIAAAYTHLESQQKSRFQINKLDDQSKVDALIPDETWALLEHAESVLSDGIGRATAQARIGQLQLELRAVKADADWVCELAAAEIKVDCGSAERIDGVCLWKRVEQKVNITDWVGITNDYAELCRDAYTFKSGRKSVHLAQAQAPAPRTD